MTGIPDPNDKTTDPEVGMDQTTGERPEPPTKDEFVAALGRVLDHAMPQGEVYAGASDDHLVLRRAYHALANYADGPGAGAVSPFPPSIPPFPSP